MSKKKQAKKAKNNAVGELQSSAQSWVPAWVTPGRVIAIIVLAGAILRFWGITERHFNESDTGSYWNTSERYHSTWKWFRSGSYKHISLPDYASRENGVHFLPDTDQAKPIMILVRGLVLILTGQRSIMLHSSIDILFALVAMWLMLRWCARTLGLRIAILSGLMWLIGGSQFVDTGRGYEYSIMTLFATLTWLSFMGRTKESLYKATFLAGLAFGAGCFCHYAVILFSPLCVVFLLAYRNSQGIGGKLKEVAAFGAGFVLPISAILLLYAALTRLSGVVWSYSLMFNLNAAKTDGGSILQRLNFVNMGNDLFILRYLNGIPFLLCIALGVAVVFVLHFRKYRWRWSICDDPLAVLNGVAIYGFLFWGCYYYKVPRTRMLELTVWPVLAGIGVHYVTSWLSNRVLKGRYLNTIQIIATVGVVASLWPHTAPLIKMGSGIRKAMVAMSAEGKIAYGECYLPAWPCTMSLKQPVYPTPSIWESFDDYLEINNYDYCYVSRPFVMSFIVTYPGAGNPLMLDTYNRLQNVTPAWRFEYGGHIQSVFEYSRLEWTRQFYRWDVWQQLHPEPTPYDVLVRNINYFDVYHAADVIRVNRESRINLLAQLIALQRKDPNRFQQVAPRFYTFVQYNLKNGEIMKQAQALAEKM